jgi:hypothetical protein
VLSQDDIFVTKLKNSDLAICKEKFKKLRNNEEWHASSNFWPLNCIAECFCPTFFQLLPEVCVKINCSLIGLVEKHFMT